MNKRDLKKLSKSQLINMLLKQSEKIPIPTPRVKKPVPAPRKSVREMVNQYEQTIIAPPMEFRDGYKPIPMPRRKKPVPMPRTKINKTDKALKGYTESYEINIKNEKDPLLQLKNTRLAVSNKLADILKIMKGFKYIETLKVTFVKMSDNERITKQAYFNNEPQTIINNTQIIESLNLSEQSLINKIAVWISETSGWIVESVDNHYLNIIIYKPTRGSSYIELPKELQNSIKGLINLKN